MKTKRAIFLALATELIAASVAFSLGTNGHRKVFMSSASPSLATSTTSFSLNSVPNNDNQDENHDDSELLPDRRRWFQHQAAMMASACFTTALPTLPASASSGLLVFPISPQTQLLKNRYHFMRAGISELEYEGIYSTNALFLTNRENRMHPSGEKTILDALKKLKTETDAFPTILYHSLAANGMDTGDFIARQLSLGREKTLPEFTYLDQRGVGLWDSGDEKLVKPAIWALDHEEAGKLGMTGRPPNNDDGTAAETLNDQFIRLRQFISLQESRTSGDNILVIFPDGTGPALLSCMIAGIPYKDVHALEFAPGEIRLDITPESVLALFEQKKNDPAYLAALDDGKQKLKALREDNVFVNLKEQKQENDNMEMDAEFNRKKMEAERERLQRMAEEQAMRAEERAKQAEAEARAREEQKRERLERAEAEKRAREEREQQRKAQMAADREARLEKERQRKQSQQSDSAMAQSTDQDSSSPLSMLPFAATGVVGLGLAAVVGSTMGSGDDDALPVETTEKEPEPILDSVESAATTTTESTDEKVPAEREAPEPILDATKSAATMENALEEKVPAIDDVDVSLTPAVSASNDILVADSIDATTTPTLYPPSQEEAEDEDVVNASGPPVVDEVKAPEIEEPVIAMSIDDVEDTEDLDSVDAVGVSSDKVIEDQLNQLAAQEQVLKDTLYESNGPLLSSTPATSTDDNSSSEVDDFLDGLDSYDNDWLQLMQDIRNEEDIEEDEESFELLPVNGDSIFGENTNSTILGA